MEEKNEQFEQDRPETQEQQEVFRQELRSDVDDILLNCFGAVTGYLLYLLWDGVNSRSAKGKSCKKVE